MLTASAASVEVPECGQGDLLQGLWLGVQAYSRMCSYGLDLGIMYCLT